MAYYRLATVCEPQRRVALGQAAMNQRDNPLFWSISLGSWFSTDVRVSWYLPLLWIVFVIKFGIAYGTAIEGALFVSVLLHEFGHVLAARRTGGQADEILIWPLGGLAFVQPARNFWSQFITTAAGPLVNLAICAACLPQVMASKYASEAWHPFILPISVAEFGAQPLTDLMVITFSLNWMCLILNLVPAHPLDGGQMTRAILSSRLGPLPGAEWAAKVSFIAAICLGLVGIFDTELTWMLGLGVFLVVMAMQELQRIQFSEMTEDSEFGYDFSQGYTSLERSSPSTREPRVSVWQRWKQERELERRKREMEQEHEAEVQLDAILAKLHEGGMAALSASEKRILERASAKYRKGRPNS